jgi:hypothetical protein
VFHDVLDLHLVDHLIGGYVRASWTRLKPYIEARRVDVGANFAEWFQWLAERMEAFPAPSKQQGAHRTFRSWKP